MKKDILTFKLLPETGISDFCGRMNRGIRSVFSFPGGQFPFSYPRPPKNRTHPPVSHMLKTDLCFGLSKPVGGIVSEQEWDAFTDRHVTPVFGEGLTVMDGYGQWRMIETNEIIKEKIKLLILLHENRKAIHQSIEQIREVYKRLFHQESVLRITSPVWISL